MIKFATAAALAAIFAAAPALAGEVRIPVEGKSQAQLQTEIRYAARSVCAKETHGETMRLEAFARCMQQTLETTRPQLARLETR